MEISSSRRYFPNTNPTVTNPLKDQTLKSVQRYYCNLSSEGLKCCVQSHLTQISELRKRICELICHSKFFEVGNQEENAPSVFQGFLNYPSEVKSLVHAQSYPLIPRFDSDAALYDYLFTLYTAHERLDKGLGALQDLLKQNLASTQKSLIDILRKEGYRLAQNAQLSDPDTPYSSYLPSFLSTRLFAQCSAALQDIYGGLLAIEWMEKENVLIEKYRENTSKYNYVSSPHLRRQTNSEHLLNLEREVSLLVSSSYFFQYGEQEDDKHFQGFFQSFIAHLRGVESIVQHAVDYFTEHYPRHKDTSFSEGFCPQLIKDFNSILETNQGLKRRFLEVLRKEKRQLRKGEKNSSPHQIKQGFEGGPKFTDVSISPHHSFPVYLVKNLLGWGPKHAQILQDIFTKLLVITWLEKDSEELNVYLGLKEPAPDVLPEAPPAFIFQEKVYGLRPTKPDGACGLHALLGELNNGEYVCLEDPRQAFIQKIRENFQDARVKREILEILLGYLNAQEDPFSRMLFENPEGNRLNQTFLEIKTRFQKQVKALKEEEANLWLQEMPSIREKALEEARKSEQYAEMEDETILKALRESKLKLLDLISPEREPFSRLLSPEKKGQTVLKSLGQQEVLARWLDTEADFLTSQLYPHYLIALASGEFFLNTQEITLAALLFYKKTQVVHARGAATEVIFPEGEGEPTIIYHEGCHFFRCTPCTQEEIEILTDPERIRRVNQKKQDCFDYMQAKSLANHQREKDLHLLQRYRSSLKEEVAQCAVSGGLSIVTGNPRHIIMQLSRTAVNTAGVYIDPLGESKEVRVLKLLGSSGFVHLLGGNMLQLGTALAVDLASLATQEKDMSKSENTVRNLGFGILKGDVTLDPEKFFKQVSTTMFSETVRNLSPEEDISDGWDSRLLRALCTNADIQGSLVDRAFKDNFKEQAKDPQQVLPEDSEKKETPLPNPEIQSQLDDALIEHSKEDAIYKDKQLGTKQAKEYRDDKYQNWNKKNKHGTKKEEKRACRKYEGAKTKVTDAEAVESQHKAIADSLKSKVEVLKENLYTPVSSDPDRSHLLDSHPSPVDLRIEVVAEKKMPLPNPEIQHQLDDALIEHSKEDTIYKDKQLGTKQAKEYRDDKYQNWNKKIKHGTKKEEKRACRKYEGAKTKVTDAEAVESQHKAIADSLKSKVEVLKENLYTPITEKAPKGPLDPEEQLTRPQQTPTAENLQRQEELEQQQAAFDKWQEDSKAYTLALTNAENNLIQKEAVVTNAQDKLDKKFRKYRKADGVFNSADREWKKVVTAKKNKADAVRERDTAQKVVNDLKGIELVEVLAPKVKPKKPKTVVDKVWKWAKENVAVSGEMSVGSAPLYKTEPSTASDRYVPRERPIKQENPPPKQPQPTSYDPRSYGISQGSAQTDPKNLQWTWKDIQAHQTQQIFEMNMAHQSPSKSISNLLDYSWMVPEGMSPNNQLAPHRPKLPWTKPAPLDVSTNPSKTAATRRPDSLQPQKRATSPSPKTPCE